MLPVFNTSVLDNFKAGSRNKPYLDIGNASKQKVGVYSLNFLVQFPLREPDREQRGDSFVGIGRT